MRTITAVESISLDGVMQAPGRPDEDPRGGFAHGGWATPYAADPVQGRVMSGHREGESDLLFGRRTYELFHRSWAGRTDNPFSPRLDAGHKYVVSATGPLIWANSERLLVHPLILGAGERPPPDDAPHATLRLADATPTGAGVLITRYVREGR